MVPLPTCTEAPMQQHIGAKSSACFAKVFALALLRLPDHSMIAQAWQCKEE